MNVGNVRPCILAGSWYPADPKALRLSVESYINGAASHRSTPDTTASGHLCGLVLPHAGHRYSGKTCAAGVGRMKNQKISRVILIGPSHRARIPGAALTCATHFETPLGRVPVDTDAVNKLAAGGFRFSEDAHESEHCLEIILPFLQGALTDFRIVPVLIGPSSDAERAHLAAQLRGIIDERTILIASSDFVHYGDDFGYTPDVGEDVRAGVRAIDDGAIDRIRAMDADGFLKYRQKSGATICGAAPISLLMDTLPKNAAVDVVDYSQSADVSDDTGHMVSYAALAFYGPS